MRNRNDETRHAVAEVAESVIAKWVDTACNIMLATLGSDDVEGRRVVKQMRHLHLAEPGIPAQRIAQQLSAE